MSRPRSIGPNLGERLISAIEALYPPSCPICRTEARSIDGVCAACWRDLTFIATPGCHWCGRPMPGVAGSEPDCCCDTCLRTQPLWRRGRSTLLYKGVGRRLVLGLKHGDRADLVPNIAHWMLRASPEFVHDAEIILPVPLHWRRRLRRRFNQSAEIARRLCRIAGKPRAYRPMAIRRLSFDGSQDGRDAEARRRNVEGVFSTGTQVRDKGVLLVDDVLTTGATLNSATRALLDGGAAHVDVLTLALVSRGESTYMADPEEEIEDETC